MKATTTLVLIAFAATFSVHVQAAPTTDPLGTCLVEHTSQQDRATFIKWMFAQLALAPTVAPMVSISTTQRQALNQQTAKLFMRLLTHDCANEARTAYLLQGDTALAAGFQVLGSAAARGLMLDPHVTAGMSGFNKYLDRAKIEAALAGSSTTPPPAGSSEAGH